MSHTQDRSQNAPQSAGEAPTAQNQPSADYSLLPTVHSSLLAARTQIDNAIWALSIAQAEVELKLAAFADMLEALQLALPAIEEGRDPVGAANEIRAAIAK